MKTGDLPRTGVVIAAIGLLVLGCTPTVSRTEPAEPARESAPLAKLTVAPDGPMIGYSRARFGQPWKDVDGNGCDQRSDVLVRDAGIAERDARRPCKVVAIALPDPYTGQVLDDLADIEIDHVVSLGAAWRAGASTWTDDDREHFANDKANLLAVRDKVNQAKSDRSPERFRPLIHADSWCQVATIYVTVSDTYHLTVTAASRDALTEMLATCQP